MSKDGGDFRNLTADLRFQSRHDIVGLFEAQGFVELQVLLHMQTSGKILDTHVMDAEVVARSHSANTVENIFMPGFARDGVDDYIAIGKDVVNRVRDLRHRLSGTLEGDVASQAHGQVGKVAVAGASNADPLDFDHAADLEHRIDDARAVAGGRGVEQRVDRLPRQP